MRTQRSRYWITTHLAFFIWILQPDAFVAANTPTVTWTRHAIDLPESVWSVEALDANADGKLDLIAMGHTTVFALIAPAWKTHVLADTKEPKMLYCVGLDADADGDMDLAVGRYQVPWIEHRKALAEGRASQEPRGPDFSVAWIENKRSVAQEWPLHIVDRELNGIHGLWTGDVDGDGRKDLLADSIMGPHFAKSLAWFRSPGASGATFARHIITKEGAEGRPHYLDFADLNGDGRGDLLVGDSGGGMFTWWESPTAREGVWNKHSIARENGATNIKSVDVNRDGKPDVVASCGHGKGVFWFEGPDWKKHVIDAEFRDPHALAIGDFDRDGDTDVATASFTTFVVRWYRNDGKASFIVDDIDVGNKQQAYDMKTADVDGDGRLDLILAGRESRNVVWYRNNPTGPR